MITGINEHRAGHFCQRLIEHFNRGLAIIRTDRSDLACQASVPGQKIAALLVRDAGMFIATSKYRVQNGLSVTAEDAVVLDFERIRSACVDER